MSFVANLYGAWYVSLNSSIRIRPFHLIFYSSNESMVIKEFEANKKNKRGFFSQLRVVMLMFIAVKYWN